MGLDATKELYISVLVEASHAKMEAQSPRTFKTEWGSMLSKAILFKVLLICLSLAPYSSSLGQSSATWPAHAVLQSRGVLALERQPIMKCASKGKEG